MKEGTPIFAARGGRVIYVQDKYTQGGADEQRYYKKDNRILILHDDGTVGFYFHLQHKGVAVKMEQMVQAGEMIGYSGNTGFSTHPHLHFEVGHLLSNHHQILSIPIRFRTKRGIVDELVEGESYIRP